MNDLRSGKMTFPNHIFYSKVAFVPINNRKRKENRAERTSEMQMYLKILPLTEILSEKSVKEL